MCRSVDNCYNLIYAVGNGYQPFRRLPQSCNKFPVRLTAVKSRRTCSALKNRTIRAAERAQNYCAAVRLNSIPKQGIKLNSVLNLRYVRFFRATRQPLAFNAVRRTGNFRHRRERPACRSVFVWCCFAENVGKVILTVK